MIYDPRSRPVAALVRDRDGATIVEFALILIPFLTLIMGALDVGYQLYLRALTTGAVERAARTAAVGGLTSAQITDMITAEVRTILPNSERDNPQAIQVAKTNYYNFSNVGGGERITGDTAPVGQYNATDCYEDRNGNGRFDATSGGATGLGGADDIVYYDVTVTITRLFPVAALFGASSTMTVGTKTLIRNQPFGQQVVTVRCT
ncbi:TadE/TadG family type IV pilus assembly protein [Sphingomonas qomolangmaensis]|uniref:Pilus assembly protein n=1 Tax=Sphingomonas qomolangmaensis TaxID=2918765 RepID=A0ABY5LBZ0_9SPHN|nr:TadE family protein [Sphingomonas qomolangmaensis]UUL83340.1 pilus assembly protein [Sphingomonas qomolangmaensis]